MTPSSCPPSPHPPRQGLALELSASYASPAPGPSYAPGYLGPDSVRGSDSDSDAYVEAWVLRVGRRVGLAAVSVRRGSFTGPLVALARLAAYLPLEPNLELAAGGGVRVVGQSAPTLAKL